jgi:hypothetical protein
MDGIVKIVLALNLKFLLIILSIGTSYFVEHSINKKVDPVSTIETLRPDSSLRASGNIDARSLFKAANDNYGSRLESGIQVPIQTINYFSDKPFNSRGLEIYIEL